jgi:hypothetical protein
MHFCTKLLPAKVACAVASCIIHEMSSAVGRTTCWDDGLY